MATPAKAPTGKATFAFSSKDVRRESADFLDFVRPIATLKSRFDNRLDSALKKAAFSATAALERESALWELADRLPDKILDVTANFIESEPQREARIHALWLLQRCGGVQSVQFLRKHFSDEDPEVADWSRRLVEELTGELTGRVYGTVKVFEDRIFDQSLPLLISGTVLVHTPSEPLKVTVSPMWFETVMGRVMACTNHETIMSDLVIEKNLSGLHPDGSSHYEIFKFKGSSFALSDRLYEHYYQSLTPRRFYPSGIVEQGESLEVDVALDRVAISEFVRVGEQQVSGDGPKATRLKSQQFVRTVRGRFHGWAAVHLKRYMSSGWIAPGDIQLSNPTHPAAGPLTNARLFGTFRGKISDYDGDGELDINYIPCHGTVDGEHDLYCDGSKMRDPFSQ